MIEVAKAEEDDGGITIANNLKVTHHNGNEYIFQATTSTSMGTSPPSRISISFRLTMVNFYKATRSFARGDKWLESRHCFGCAALVLLV